MPYRANMPESDECRFEYTMNKLRKPLQKCKGF